MTEAGGEWAAGQGRTAASMTSRDQEQVRDLPQPLTHCISAEGTELP